MKLKLIVTIGCKKLNKKEQQEVAASVQDMIQQAMDTNCGNTLTFDPKLDAKLDGDDIDVQLW